MRHWSLLLLPLLVCCSEGPQPVRWEFPCSIRSLDVHDDSLIRFAGSNGWLGLTIDGGRTWKTHQARLPNDSISSFRSSGFADGHWHVATIASPGMIAKMPQRGFDLEWVHHLPDEQAFLDAMCWVNDTVGVVLGDAIGDCLTMLRTTNGGSSWERLPCSALPPRQEGEAAFAASNGNFASSGDTVWAFTGGQVSRCLRSLDAGQTWSAFPLPIAQGQSMTGAFASSFSNHREGLAIGGNWEDPDDNHRNLCSTNDGGSTWTLMSEGSGPGYRSCILHHPTDPRDVVAIGFQGIDVSHDGGHTWKHVTDSSHFVGRFSPNGRTLWLAGNKHVEKRDWPLSFANEP